MPRVVRLSSIKRNILFQVTFELFTAVLNDVAADADRMEKAARRRSCVSCVMNKGIRRSETNGAEGSCSFAKARPSVENT